MKKSKNTDGPSATYEKILRLFKDAGVVFRKATTFDLVHNQPPVNWSIEQMVLASLLDGVTLVISHEKQRGNPDPEEVIIKFIQNMGEQTCRAVRLEYDFPRKVWVKSTYIPRHDILDYALAVLLGKKKEPLSPLSIKKRISERAAMQIIDGFVSVSRHSLASRRI